MCVLFFFFSTYTGPRWAATAVYVVGFLLLDCVIHTAQASVRAMMSDLSGELHPSFLSSSIVLHHLFPTEITNRGTRCVAPTAAANHGPSVGQAIFSVWMAIGSILGYAAVAYGTWHRYILVFFFRSEDHVLLLVLTDVNPSYVCKVVPLSEN